MLNVVIPMAGRGSRFVEAGYAEPKPLIDVCGRPMIQLVVENLRLDIPHRFVFICQEEHLKEHNLGEIIEGMGVDFSIVVINEITSGAASTVLQARAYIDNDDPLVIANSDQYVTGSISQFVKAGLSGTSDGHIMTMRATDAKWSFVERAADGRVIRVVEKVPISDEATVGIYHFRRGRDFVAAAQEMIAANDRTNGEFYVAPTYNFLITHGAVVTAGQVGDEGRDVFGLGTPEDLSVFKAWLEAGDTAPC